jgi:hypothetical protein
MPSSELIEQAQARLHARAGHWAEFHKSASEMLCKSLGKGRAGSPDWLSELWFEFALSHDHVRLSEFSQWLVNSRQRSSFSLPSLSSLVDAAAKEPRMQWLLQREDLHAIWVAGTEVPVPNKEWRSRYYQGSGDVLDAYSTWMREQSTSIQERQKAYLAKYGHDAMPFKSLLYYAICAYGEPSKEQVRAAALCNNPVYDMQRLNEHYPGIAGLKAACEGMGMKHHDLRNTLEKFIDNMAQTIEEAAPENGFEAN